MGIDSTGGDDHALAGDDFGSGPYDDSDVRLYVGITSFADSGNPPILDCDIGFDNSPVIEDQGVRDDRIHCALTTRTLRLPHPVANNFAATELHFLAVGREVLFHLDH